MHVRDQHDAHMQWGGRDPVIGVLFRKAEHEMSWPCIQPGRGLHQPLILNSGSVTTTLDEHSLFKSSWNIYHDTSHGLRSSDTLACV